MTNNNENKRKRKKAVNGKRVNQTISFTSLNILEKSGIKPSEAVERYAMILATGTSELMITKKIYEFEIERLEREIRDIERKAADDIKTRREYIKQYETQLQEIENTLMEYNPSISINAQNAHGEAMQLIKHARLAADGKKWGIKKVPLEALDEIAKRNYIPLPTLLSKIDRTVKKDWIENGDKI